MTANPRLRPALNLAALALIAAAIYLSGPLLADLDIISSLLSPQPSPAIALGAAFWVARVLMLLFGPGLALVALANVIWPPTPPASD